VKSKPNPAYNPRESSEGIHPRDGAANGRLLDDTGNPPLELLLVHAGEFWRAAGAVTTIVQVYVGEEGLRRPIGQLKLSEGDWQRARRTGLTGKAVRL